MNYLNECVIIVNLHSTIDVYYGLFLPWQIVGPSFYLEPWALAEPASA